MKRINTILTAILSSVLVQAQVAASVPNASGQSVTVGRANWTPATGVHTVVRSDNNQYASVVLSGGSSGADAASQFLQLNNFGFNLPANASIRAITVNITAHASTPVR